MKNKLLYLCMFFSAAIICAAMGVRRDVAASMLSGYPTIADSIHLIQLAGEIYPDSVPVIEFEWETSFPYSGTYTLKIMELDSSAAIPDSLPDTDLFYSQSEISGTLFTYPAGAPLFQEGFLYVWQIETDANWSGGKVKSGLGTFFPVPFPFNCSINFSGVPTSPICPGTCFTLQIALPSNSFSFPSYQHRFTVYTDHAVGADKVTANGQPAFELAELCGLPETPQASQSGGNTYNLEICVLEGSSQPVEIALYYNRWSSNCASQCASLCCHEIETFTVDVHDITGYEDIQLEIKSFSDLQATQEICSGDPVHFSVLNAPVGALPVWQVWNSVSSTWDDIPTFNGQAFPVGPGHPMLTLDCSNSSQGHEEKTFRATFIETTPGGDVCEFTTNEYPLRICCPLSPATLDILPNSLLCEGDMETFVVTLQSPDIFVQSPGDFVSIVWSATGAGILNITSPTSIEYELTLPDSDVCFTAIINNCSGKERIVQQCVKVDPRPVCGVLTGISTNLTLVSVDPSTGDETYTMCPGEDAVLEAIGYDKCTLNWEYSDDGGATWLAVGGVSNTIQNTNTLFPPGSGCRHYRVLCKPESDPSGCPTCVSNIVRICEVPEPSLPIIGNCPAQLCHGATLALSVTNIETGVDYTWLCNGLEIGQGAFLSIIAEKDACYWVEASNGCTVVESAPCCIEVCETVAIISCPLPPNECACLGEPITLTASDSYTNCLPGDLIYEWFWLDELGAPQSANSVTITDTPPLQGTLYSLTVTDLLTGCVGETQLFIKPCDKN